MAVTSNYARLYSGLDCGIGQYASNTTVCLTNIGGMHALQMAQQQYLQQAMYPGRNYAPIAVAASAQLQAPAAQPVLAWLDKRVNEVCARGRKALA